MRVTFALLVAVFIVKLIITNWSSVRGQITHLDYAILAESAFLSAIGYAYWAFLWRASMQAMGERLSHRQALRIWTYSQAARYLPGVGWQFAGRVYLCHKDGLSKKISSISLLLENILLLCSCLIVGSVTLMAGIKSAKLPWLALIVILLASGLLIMQPHRFTRLLNTALVRFGKQPIELQLSPAILLKFLALYTVIWILHGLAFSLCLKSFGLHDIPIITAIGIFSASWAVGFLFVIAPSGLGVREFTVATMLRRWSVFNIGMAVAIASRIVMILGEMGVLAFAFLWETVSAKKERQPGKGTTA